MDAAVAARAREGRGDENAAVIALDGEAEPELLADLPGDRVGRARDARAGGGEHAPDERPAEQLDRRRRARTRAGRTQVFGEPDLERLWEAVADVHPARRGRPGRGLAGARRQLTARAATLDELQPRLARFHGRGTDLTVGLLPESRWLGAESLPLDGLPYVANMPTEEVFTTPDSRRDRGHRLSTRPLRSTARSCEGLELRFEHGRIVDVSAEKGADVIRGQLATHEQAPYLGEVALVDGASRIGQTGLTFFDGLFDENATCHIAYGSCYTECLRGQRPVEGANEAPVHTDPMIGGPEVASTG